ncbi:MAG: hypothetical protein A2086_11595 [Spirochaetes bacterium GWD1_27_9]|nr:MAG: hypothetical protein A2Z98_06290 [Spirochaetes bacterium GWB1_27_13]OHD21758.1 MAG: hypothetical protein A2Y34_12355 [Spirochaetes bacterium GWC1_27_15]OHD38079.1 MAG: hypothetical protein A2086_11595 [Spirochaetes bacterium GWD1_27_9]
MQKNNVYITYYKSISALGINTNETLLNLENGNIPIYTPKEDEKFKYPHFIINNKLENEKTARCSNIAFNLLSIIDDKLINIDKIPLFLATSTGGIKETEKIYKELIDKKIQYPLFQNHFFNKTMDDIKTKYKNKFIDGYTFSTACSSSGHSILQAYKFIKNGIIDKALILGIDTLALTTMIGFDSLKLVSHTGTKPLTNQRDGLSLGEGGGLLFLESNPKDTPHAEITGCFSNSDGYHISSPDPEGEIQKQCILETLKESSVSIEDVDYINAHGTGTIMNDEVELKTIKSIFKNPIPVTSLKHFIGHTLGASTITEIAIAIAMLKNKKIYQPKSFCDPIDKDYIPLKTIQKDVKYFLKNSFGFGGNNFSILLKII